VGVERSLAVGQLERFELSSIPATRCVPDMRLRETLSEIIDGLLSITRQALLKLGRIVPAIAN